MRCVRYLLQTCNRFLGAKAPLGLALEIYSFSHRKLRCEEIVKICFARVSSVSSVSSVTIVSSESSMSSVLNVSSETYRCFPY